MPGHRLVVIPGEKAAAAMMSAAVPGHTPVSTSADAGMANADYSMCAGRDVVVWADADAPKKNPKTGKPIKRSADYANTAAKRILAAGATSIHMVNLDAVRAAVPPGGKMDGADAADVPLARIPDLLVSATEWEPSTEGEPSGDGFAGREGNDPPGYAWYDAGDFLPPWECTPDADCMRMMRRHAVNLLVVHPDDGSLAFLRAANESGIWARADGEIDLLIATTALEWAQDAAAAPVDEVDKHLASAVVKWQKSISKVSARHQSQRSADMVLRRWIKDGTVPPGLTECQEANLDGNTRYLGAPNGVIDLFNGNLLTGDDARSCLVSRSLTDFYDPDAMDPAVDQLFAYFPGDAYEWLLSAMGHALRGRPNSRDYLLVGETKTGKSTLFGAIAAALGDHAGFIPVGAIAQKKYAGGPEPEMEAFTNRRLMFYSEPPANLDYQRSKNQSGGDTTAFRKMRSDIVIERRTTATRFFACNPDDVPRLPWHIQAMYERLRALPYPAVPVEKVDLTLPDRLNTVRSRQALAALLVRYAVANPKPPDDIPSVATLRRELRDESTGEAGEWLETALVPSPDGVATSELWEAARRASGETSDGRAWGQTPTKVYRLCPPDVETTGSLCSPDGGCYEGAKRMDGLEVGNG